MAGILPEDAPDLHLEQVEQLKFMLVPVMGLVPQPSLEDTDSIGLACGQDNRGYSYMSVSITYTLWRNPNDRSAPINLADLNEEMRTATAHVPPWPRPTWLVEQVARMRYPQLWEAVRTTWHRDSSEHSSVRTLLVDHVNHILVNQYREEPGLTSSFWDRPVPTVSERMVNGRVSVLVNGVQMPGAEVDADLFVYGVGAELPGGGVMTLVLPRAELKHIQNQFTTRRQKTTNPSK